MWWTDLDGLITECLPLSGMQQPISHAASDSGAASGVAWMNPLPRSGAKSEGTRPLEMRSGEVLNQVCSPIASGCFT